MGVIPNPLDDVYSKTTAGNSDTSSDGESIKFMGCSVLSINSTLGWNETPGSVDVSLVEDFDKGDSFEEPTTPSLWAISLPSGGVGQTALVGSSFDFDQDSFEGNNVPFYFAGICSSWRKGIKNVSGKTISVNLSDVREVLRGVQVITGEWALSQNFTASQPRFDYVENVIDAFGYFEHGFESGKTDLGMPWENIKTAIEDCRVKIFGMYFEFYFTGTAFTDAPSGYSISSNVVDIVSLASKVAKDGGSDLVAVCRKVASTEAVVEFRSIRRYNTDTLTQSEITNFIGGERSTIISAAEIGREFRNEPVSSVIVGGQRNSNYVAYPTSADTYDNTYENFPVDVESRVFTNGVGAIFPFWGFGPGSEKPLDKPVLYLDHVAFTRDDLREKIPLVEVVDGSKTVRSISHSDVFMDGDGDSDSRPWAIVSGSKIQTSNEAGWFRGLPLNTEVLNASFVSQEVFEQTYSIYYPTLADSMSFRKFDASGVKIEYEANVANGMTSQAAAEAVSIEKHMFYDPLIHIEEDVSEVATIHQFRTQVYNWTKAYAEENMGRKFIVALPKSEIMTRIWNNQSVPTNSGAPIIEYFVDNKGYWEEIPSEFDGISASGTPSAAEKQILDKFQAEDGRFYPMVAMDWKPTGNINFASDGSGVAMFQDLPPSDFAPNRIANGNPDYIFMSCNVSQLKSRPDLALVTLPSPVSFDPLGYLDKFENVDLSSMSNRSRNRNSNIYKWFAFLFQKEDYLNNIGLSTDEQKNIISYWGEKVSNILDDFYLYNIPSERVMDLKGAVIPLTSNWVSYGPWYYETNLLGGASIIANGMVDVEVDQSLVPWNFPRVTNGNWDDNLNEAGESRLENSLSLVDYVDSAKITVAGFPEISPASAFGFNSNLTSVSVSFSDAGITTVYSLSTYAGKPGTYRKVEHNKVNYSNNFEITPRTTENVNFEARAGIKPYDTRINRFLD